MADKSPRKQNKGTKLSAKEKKAKKKAKQIAKANANDPETARQVRPKQSAIGYPRVQVVRTPSRLSWAG